jgi:isopentenyl diphosphate isomerase/L-lactate dehydrogenase-like FMN-dependent dehydrogenase
VAADGRQRIDGSANNALTLARNAADFDRIVVKQCVLRDVFRRALEAAMPLSGVNRIAAN